MQIVGVVVATLTARPEDAEARKVNSGYFNERVAIGENLIDWPSRTALNERVTEAAELNLMFPGCVAVRVQVPAANSVTVWPSEPPTVQTVGVSEVTTTGRRDEAVARTENTGRFSVRSAIDGIEIVWALTADGALISAATAKEFEMTRVAVATIAAETKRIVNSRISRFKSQVSHV